MTREFPSLTLYRQKRDARKITIKSRGRKLATMTIFTWHKTPVDACADFMTGWFGTEDRSKWKYRVTYG